MTTQHTGDSPVWEDAEYNEEAVRDGIPRLRASMYRLETEYKEHLIALLEESGWTVETEVLSDCGRGRVDIIADHPAVGCVGIEVKRTPTIYRPESPARGIAQLLNYQSYTFSDHDVDYWVLAPGFDSKLVPRQGTTDPKVRIKIMFKRILVELKFGMISWERIIFGNYQGLRIPLRNPETVTSTDLDQIDEYLAERKWHGGEYDPRW